MGFEPDPIAVPDLDDRLYIMNTSTNERRAQQEKPTMRPDTTTDLPALAPAHDNRHSLGSDSRARESLVYLIQVPEERIGGFVYTWVTGGGLAGAAVCLFGPGIGDNPLFDRCDGIAVADDADFTDWRIGGLHLELGEPLLSARLSFAGRDMAIDYEFEATDPAYAYSTNANGCPPWIADDRFEQQGRIRGRLRIGDREVAFDGFSQRDHSWGTRDWGVNQHWKWVHAQAGDDLGLHFWQLESLGRTHLYGYVHSDGRIAQVTSVDVDMSIDDELQQKALRAIVQDAAGRSTAVSAEAYAVFPMQVDPMVSLYEAPLIVDIDGKAGIGWCETLWTSALIEYMRGKTTGNS